MHLFNSVSHINEFLNEIDICNTPSVEFFQLATDRHSEHGFFFFKFYDILGVQVNSVLLHFCRFLCRFFTVFHACP